MDLTKHLQHGPATSRELQRATGLSQPVISRQLTALGDTVIALRHGRSIRYALTCGAFGAADPISIYEVDTQGVATRIAFLRPLIHGGFAVQLLPGAPSVLLGDDHGLFDDLPYFLDDLRPQGFLGRWLAREISSVSPEFPAEPRNWNTDHIGRYLISAGEDLPGNILLGQFLHIRGRRTPHPFTEDRYPDLAAEILRGSVPGSSAGGEQPKFAVFNPERGHVIVKFSPTGNDPSAVRRRDILITEHHAAAVLRNAGYPVADSRLMEIGDQIFLESVRFDRVGKFGRLPMVSLAAVDAEFVGSGSNWVEVVTELHDQGLIDSQAVRQVRVLQELGRAIHNTDMHLGNLSLSYGSDGFSLLPAYDMGSMGFAPGAGGPSPFVFERPPVDGEAGNLADRFWENVAQDERISDEFRGYLE